MATGLDSVGQARIKSMIRQRYLPQPTSSFAASAAPMAAAGGPAPAATSYSPPPTPPPAAPAAISNPAAPPPGAPGPNAGAPTPSSMPAPNVNYGGGFGGTINDILRAGQGAGYFSPGYNPGIMDAVREFAMRDAAASRAHTELQSESLGADPATAASYGLRAGLNSQGDVADALSNATYGEATHQRDFLQSLMSGWLNKQGPQNVYNPATGPSWLNAIGAFLGGSGEAAKGAAGAGGG